MTDSTYCNAGIDPALSTKQCSIPMSVLISTYGYSSGDPIKAKIRAQNSKGWSVYSDDSSGINAQAKPSSAPLNLILISRTTNTATI